VNVKSSSRENLLPFRPAETTRDQRAGLRLEIEKRGDFVVEIIEDRSLPVFHCIIQRGAEVVFWGQYTTRTEAEDAAEERLSLLSPCQNAA